MTSSLSRIDSNAKSIQIDANLLLIVSISLVAISGVVGINPIMPNIAKSLNIRYVNKILRKKVKKYLFH